MDSGVLWVYESYCGVLWSGCWLLCDWLVMLQDVVDTHPGLTFLQDAPEFHSRYVQTVEYFKSADFIGRRLSVLC